MKIKLDPEVLKLIGDRDPERLANDLLFLYLKGGLIKHSEIAGRFSIPHVHRKESETFDAQTHAFAGVVVGESLWVPDMGLRDMLEANTDIVVLNSPRKTGISRARGKHNKRRTQ